MTREEWRAYNKRMKALAARDKKIPQLTTLEEKTMLTEWHLERADRDEKIADKAFNIAIAFLIIAGVANVVSVVFNILTLIYR